MNHWNQIQIGLNRRTFLSQSGVGLGAAALSSLLSGEKTATAQSKRQQASIGGLPGLPHFAPKAKRVIFLCMAGGPTHLETFDYKPKLAQMDGSAVCAVLFRQIVIPARLVPP